MNFLIATVVYHCKEYSVCLTIVKFLFEMLELSKIFCFQNFKAHEMAFKYFLQYTTPRFYEFFEWNDMLDFKMILIDWFFTLGFSKLPLEDTTILLINIMKGGWFFFFWFLLTFFDDFYFAYEKDILESEEEESSFPIQAQLK